MFEENLLEKIKQEEEEEEGEENGANAQTIKQKTKFKCNYCEQTYKAKFRVIIHETTHTGENIYKCDLCFKVFSQVNPFINHYRRSHIYIGTFNCEICNKTFNKNFNLKQHQKLHLNQGKKFICGYCGKGFWRKISLSEHILGDIKKRDYKCEFCTATFSRQCLLTVHLSKENHTNKTKYPCEICGKVYFIKHSLQTHMRTHKEKLKCNICGSEFFDKYKLDQHTNLHNKEVEYCCDICGKIYFHFQNFKIHCSRHGGAETEECKGCYQKFTQKSLLNIHAKKCENLLQLEILSQTGGQKTKIKCEYCDKTYKRRYSLIIHENTHTGENIYKCDLCHKIYSQVVPFRSHYQKMHIDHGIFNCEICNKTFTKKCYLKQHQKSHAPPKE